MTIELDLPDGLRRHVDAQVAAGGYADAADYLRDLVRRDRERQTLRALVLGGIASGPGEVVDDAWFDDLRAGAVEAARAP